MKINLLKTFLFLAVLALSNIHAQESYDLSYKFKDGKTYRYNYSLSMNMTQEVMGQEMKVLSTHSMAVNLVGEKTGKTDEVAIIAAIDTGSIRTSMPMRDTTISLKDISGKRQQTIMTTRGKVLLKKLLDTLTIHKDLSRLLERAIPFIQLPEKSIKPGEPWNVSELDSMDLMGGKIYNTMNLKYTIVGREKIKNSDCLKITLEGTIESEGKSSMMGMQLQIEGSGKMNGTFYLDPAEGLIVRSETNLDDDLTLAATGAQNMIIPISQNAKILIDYIE